MSEQVNENARQEEVSENKPRQPTMFICGKGGALRLEDLSENYKKIIQEIINDWSNK
jgi:hypothetical protein